MKRSEALRLRSIIELAAQSLTDETALTAHMLFPKWKSGCEYSEGVKLQYKDVLYKVRQSHTSQDDWTPDVTPSLYTVIDETHDGSEDNPIPYSGNMTLTNGLYYMQDGVTYRCTRDTVNPVYHALSELVGLYVEVI